MDIETIGVITLAVSALGAGSWLANRKPKVEPNRVQVARYVKYVPGPGEHVHEAGEFTAEPPGWHCTVMVDGQECGLHKHVYYASGKCACGQTGEPGSKEWAPE